MKKFRNAMVAICLMICAFALTACGGGQLSTEAGVSKKGFVAASKSDYTEFQTATTPDVSEIKSMKATTVIKLTAGKTVIRELAITAIVSVTETGNVDGIALKLGSNTADKKVTIEAYYNEGYSYFKVVNGKETKKYKVATTDVSSSEFVELLNTVDLEQLVNDFLTALNSVEDVNTEGVTFEKAVKGDNRRFHVGINDTKEKTTSDTYVEFQGNKLVGIESETTAENEYLGGLMYAKVAVNKFTGNIKFPSLKGYEEITADALNKIMKEFVGA